MTELEQVRVGDSAAAPPAAIPGGISNQFAHCEIEGAPRTIYEELWHIAYWQRVSLDWIQGVETPLPAHASGGFPAGRDGQQEPWEELRARYFREAELAAARDSVGLEHPVGCPSRPGMPTRMMTVREQLESLGAHNAYHFGRIVLLRQLLGDWPPGAGGFTW